jgi:hypothetical protein
MIPSISTKRATTSHHKLLNIKTTTTYDIANFMLWLLDRHTNVAGLKPLMGSYFSSLENWISNDYADINKGYNA